MPGLSSVHDDLEACALAWQRGLAEVEAFHHSCLQGEFEAGEAYRVAALCHMEASLDAMERAHRALRVGRDVV